MTDIDALVAEARDWQSRWDAGRVTPGTEMLVGSLIDALTTERARVVELEAFRNGYKNYIRKLQDSVEAERAKVAALEAEVARWREAKAEPVAWAYVNPDGECEQIEWGPVFDDPHVTPLYASPPAPEMP